jgi:hypothetical protein
MFGQPGYQPDNQRARVLVIDGDAARAQQLAWALTLADAHALVATSTLEAHERVLRSPTPPWAVVLGQLPVQTGSDFVLMRLLQRLARERGGPVPAFLLPVSSRALAPLTQPGLAALAPLPMGDPSTVARALLAQVAGGPRDDRPAAHCQVLDMLPGLGLEPRQATRLRSRNAHFRQVLSTAHALIGPERWAALIGDVGLAQYRQSREWPPDDDDRDVPAEHLSLLNQAVEMAAEDGPAEENAPELLRRWGDAAAQSSLDKHGSSALTQQAIKLLSDARLLSITLNAFTHDMDDVRGEELHRWVEAPDGCYYLVHYSNLYAYARTRRAQPACHIWLGSLDATLRWVHLEDRWRAVEVECACQTQTGHCLFAILPR